MLGRMNRKYQTGKGKFVYFFNYQKNLDNKHFSSVNSKKDKNVESRNPPIFVYTKHLGYFIAIPLAILIFFIILGHNFYALINYQELFTNDYVGNAILQISFLQLGSALFGIMCGICYLVHLNRYLNSEEVALYSEKYKALIKFLTISLDVFPIIIIFMSFLNLFLYFDCCVYFFDFILDNDVIEYELLEKIPPFFYKDNFHAFYFYITLCFFIWTRTVNADFEELQEKIDNEKK